MSTAPTINAIPTTYNGVTFRSRLEARWAIFFDLLGVKWDYEPEGYTDGETMYLPDFWLPEFDCFWEIKPTDKFDSAKVEMLVKQTGRTCFVSFGPPHASWRTRPTETLGSDGHGDGAYMYGPESWDNLYGWCGCPWCGALGIQFEGRGGRIHQERCKPWDEPRTAWWGSEKSDGRAADITRAAQQANAYQFTTRTSPRGN